MKHHDHLCWCCLACRMERPSTRHANLTAWGFGRGKSGHLRGFASWFEREFQQGTNSTSFRASRIVRSTHTSPAKTHSKPAPPSAALLVARMDDLLKQLAAKLPVEQSCHLAETRDMLTLGCLSGDGKACCLANFGGRKRSPSGRDVGLLRVSEVFRGERCPFPVTEGAAKRIPLRRSPAAGRT